MPIDTFIDRIPLVPVTNLEDDIKKSCNIQADRDQPRKLVAAFATPTQVILIFQGQ
jgi:hypothetical protein